MLLPRCHVTNPAQTTSDDVDAATGCGDDQSKLSKALETPLLEKWHRCSMEVSWTDSGKMFLRHDLKRGGRVSHAFEIAEEQAQEMERWRDA